MQVSHATALTCALLAIGCNRAKNDAPEYKASVLVEAAPGSPLGSATILRDNVALAKTSRDGRASFRLAGGEGETIALTVRCPSEYSSPAAPINVVLRTLDDPAKVPSYRALCPPQTHAVVVAVRATNGPNLPVVYLGKEVARTDPSGAAHVGLRMRPGERFELALRTDEKGSEQLIPRSPGAVFVAGDRDEVLFFDQQFSRPSSGGRARRHLGPTPIPPSGLRPH